MLFECVTSLYMIGKTFDPMSTPPFPINIEEKTIGDFHFEVSCDNFKMWCIPMKLLLINLKCIQTQILMRDDI